MDLNSVIAQIAPIAIANIQREYPNGIVHHFVSEGERIEGVPSTLHPAFYGCYDWHSAVEGHWLLVRALRLLPDAAFVAPAIDLLNRHLTAERIEQEVAYVTERPGFEMPYGMAWLLQLMAELREFASAATNGWRALLTPLEEHAAMRFRTYLTRLPYPIRTGLHSQTAFALGLAWDWATVADDQELLTLIDRRARDFYSHDVDAPLAYEPSGSDFLSPALAEADLLRRLLSPAEFSEWLWRFFGQDMVVRLPELLKPVAVVDFTDGQLAHFSGLNISRAWMARGIASALPNGDERKALFEALAQAHRDGGLPSALHADYAVSHWAPTYVLYLLSDRGIAQ